MLRITNEIGSGNNNVIFINIFCQLQRLTKLRSPRLLLGKKCYYWGFFFITGEEK